MWGEDIAANGQKRQVLVAILASNFHAVMPVCATSHEEVVEKSSYQAPNDKQIQSINLSIQ